MGETFKPFLYRKLFSQIGHYYQIGWPCARHPPLFYTHTRVLLGWTSQEQEEDGRQETMCWFYFILFFSNVHTPFFGWWLPTSFWQCYNNLGAPHSRRQGKIERPTFTISRRPLGQPIFIFFSVSLFLFSCFSSRHTHKDVELGFKHTKNYIYIYTLPYSCI